MFANEENLWDKTQHMACFILEMADAVLVLSVQYGGDWWQLLYSCGDYASITIIKTANCSQAS